jgi:hypothetical protein
MENKLNCITYYLKRIDVKGGEGLVTDDETRRKKNSPHD